MKAATFYFFLAIASLTSCFAQNAFLYRNGKKRQLLTSDDKIALLLSQKIEEDKIKSFISGVKSIQYVSQSFVILTLNKKVRTDSLHKEYKQITLLDNVQYISPVFIDQFGNPAGFLSERIIIKLRRGDSINDIKNIIISHKGNIAGQDSFDERIYYIEIRKSSDINSLQLCNEIYETGKVEYADPDMLLLIETSSDNRSKHKMKNVSESILSPQATANDPYFSQQWALSKIQVPQAWDLTPGCGAIKVAVIDNGVQKSHPDLSDNVLCGKDVTFTIFGGTSPTFSCSWLGPETNPDAPKGQDRFNFHGTHVSGIIAAVRNIN